MENPKRIETKSNESTDLAPLNILPKSVLEAITEPEKIETYEDRILSRLQDLYNKQVPLKDSRFTLNVWTLHDYSNLIKSEGYGK